MGGGGGMERGPSKKLGALSALRGQGTGGQPRPSPLCVTGVQAVGGVSGSTGALEEEIRGFPLRHIPEANVTSLTMSNPQGCGKTGPLTCCWRHVLRARWKAVWWYLMETQTLMLEKPTPLGEMRILATPLFVTKLNYKHLNIHQLAILDKWRYKILHSS